MVKILEERVCHFLHEHLGYGNIVYTIFIDYLLKEKTISVEYYYYYYYFPDLAPTITIYLLI